MKKCMMKTKKKMEMREGGIMPKMSDVKTKGVMSDQDRKDMMPKKMAAGGVGKVRKGVY
jgi:hypothetical protein